MTFSTACLQRSSVIKAVANLSSLAAANNTNALLVHDLNINHVP